MEDFASKLRGLDFSFKKFMQLLQSDKKMAAMLKQRDAILNPEDDTLMLRAANEIESLRQQLADLTARLEASEEGLTIAYMSGRYDKRKTDEAQEASEPVACNRCGGSGIVPIGDGYSVDPCPVCKVMGGSPLSQDGGKQTCAGTASHPVSQEASEPVPVGYFLRGPDGYLEEVDNETSETIRLYTTPQPAPTVQAAVAAALRKAAEVCDSITMLSDTDWAKKAILAIPHSDEALREICLKVAEEVSRPQVDGTTLQAIVDRVIGK